MDTLFRALAAVAALLGAAPFIRPATRSGQVLLWVPKLLGGALSPAIALTGLAATVRGLLRRDWSLAAAGVLGTGLAAAFISETPDVDRALTEGLGRAPRPGRLPRPRGRAVVERDVVLGASPTTGGELRADLWRPPPGTPPSGLGLVYAHGSGWRVGDKDLGTRPFFRRLAARGHVVLDIAYTLWPRSDLPAMVSEVNRAIVWLKENGPAHGVRPDGVVVMGGSAGAHLALMAAYTPGHAAFRPAEAGGDTAVRGVVAFYPPVDLAALTVRLGAASARPTPADRLADRMMKGIFAVEGAPGADDRPGQPHDIVAEMLGGSAADIPDTYRLLSPARHACPGCPPTLLLQGADDVFGLAPGVRRLHEALRAAGVASVLVEFPHTEHGFDLLLPGLSPMARAATRGVERFLAALV